MMGIVMKKVSLSVAALVAIGLSTGAASAADMGAKVYKKAPVVAAVDPWDIAFGAAIMSDYIFRGVTQSNHQPSVTAYFEPRYNINPNLQLYVGTSFESISFTNRAAAEVDIYGGIRPTFGAFAFDFGVWGYLYPGGECMGVAGFAQGGCGVGLAVLMMMLTDTFHPPAGIDPLLVVSANLPWQFLLSPVLVGAVVLTAFAFVWHRWLWHRHWPERWF